MIFNSVSLFSAEITLLECSYDSGTKKIEGILNRELDSENKDYKPWDMDQKKFLEIDLEKEILTWENMSYELLTKTPSHLYFRYEGNLTPIGKKHSSGYNFTIYYTINRINLNVEMSEHSYDVDEEFGAVSSTITIIKNFICKKIERKL